MITPEQLAKIEGRVDGACAGAYVEFSQLEISTLTGKARHVRTVRRMET
jgi:hypothetical protein